MKAIDILKIACDFTGNDEIVAKLESEETLSQTEEKTLAQLLKCLNLVQNEVASEYLSLEKIEEVEAKDFKVEYSVFSKKPIWVVWVKDRLGRNIRFKSFPDYLMIFGGKAKVKYCYAPEEITSDNQDITEALLPLRIYAYGVAREYFLLQGLSDEADIWEVRFKDSLSVFARKKHEAKMPCRRWL